MTQLHPPVLKVVPAPERTRLAYADNLKIVLVCGVIVGHATMAWTGVGTWVFDEPHVHEPLLSILLLLSVLGALFAIPVFFLLAGAFTPPSLDRKGLWRFLVDRTLRLGLPMVFFVIFLSPIIEYVDPDSAGWDGGFVSFTLHIWWPPAPGPTWFLGVLLVFSIGYAVVRTVKPHRRATTTEPRVRHLMAVAGVIALASWLVRFSVPLGHEVWRLALGQAPGWLAGFTVGAVGAERGWYNPIDPRFALRMRRIAWSAVAGVVLFIGTAIALGGDIEDFAGGGTWQSMVVAALEGVLIVSMSLWLLDLFRRRLNHQRPFARRMGRVAFAAFVIHQLVLVGLVLGTRLVPWPPEVEYLATALLGVAGSFGLAALLLHVPGVARVV